MLTTYSQNAEKNLLDYITRMREGGGNYYVVHLKFSNLLDHYKTDYQLKAAVNIISDILKAADGYVFATSDHDIFVFCRNILPNIVKKMVFQLRYLYMDDPLAYQELGIENPEFSRTYELKQGFGELLKIVREKARAIEEQNNKDKPSTILEEGGNLTPLNLANVEAELGKLNISQAFRSQPVCLNQKSSWQVLFREAYININSLASFLRIRVDLVSNRSLFKYLTQILDPKMLDYISINLRKRLEPNLSLNLNIGTLLSPSFADFSKTLDKKIRKNIVIEIQVTDVFADMPGFMRARKLLQNQGYRLCLDGLTSLSFLQIDKKSLGFDFAKIFWDPNLKSKRKDNQEVAAVVKKWGKNSVILCRCDSKEAIRYGQTLGITLFQGRYIDSIVDPRSEIIN